MKITRSRPSYQIPFSKPYIEKTDKDALLSVLTSGKLGRGPTIENFEKKFSRYIGTNYAVAVSSGTAGLHLSLRLLNLPVGSEIITTPFTYISPAYCILYERLKPVFVDIDRNTLNINPRLIKKAISSKTKAILLVHILGYPCDVESISNIAKERKLKIIEDACEAIGAEYNGKKVGSFGNPTVFSFYSNKQITTGEGGMICFNDHQDKLFLDALRNLGRKERRLIHEYLGYNYGLDELSGALGISQLKKIDGVLKRREKIAEKYNHELRSLSWLKLPHKDPRYKRSWFCYFVCLNEAIDREYVIKELELKGISTRIFFPPLHLQPYLKKTFQYKEGMFPVSEKVGRTIISLPLYTEMKFSEIKYICDTLKFIVRRM